jgi:peptide deformylase
MAIHDITKKGEPVLHRPSKDVAEAEFGTAKLRKLVNDMVETMVHAKGVGIAAPQIGIDKRIFIAESDAGPIAVLNPRIVKYSKKRVRGEEGCLSIPGKYDKLLRAKEVTVEGRTVEGKKLVFIAKDFFARIMQHEIDHLDGLLYVDRVEEQRKDA